MKWLKRILCRKEIAVIDKLFEEYDVYIVPKKTKFRKLYRWEI